MVHRPSSRDGALPPFLPSWPGKGSLLPVLLLGALAAGLPGCGEDVVEGIWRQDVGFWGPDGVHGREVAYELVLAQYGPDVAGYVRFYARSSPLNPAENPFGQPTGCRLVQGGHFDGEEFTLSLSFNAEEGPLQSVLLRLDRAQERLSGVLRSGETEGEGSGESLPISFVRFSTDVDAARGRCDDLRSLRVQGRVEPVAGLPGGLGPVVEPVPMVALVFIGTFLGQPFQFVHRTAAVTDGRFSLVLDTRPPVKALAVDTPEGSLGYAVFLLFDDRNRNGHFDFRLGGEGGEAFLGAAAEHVVTWVEGKVALRSPEEEALFQDLPQGYSLARVRWEEGRLVGLEPVPLVGRMPGEEALVTADPAAAIPDPFREE